MSGGLPALAAAENLSPVRAKVRMQLPFLGMPGYGDVYLDDGTWIGEAGWPLTAIYAALSLHDWFEVEAGAGMLLEIVGSGVEVKARGGLTVPLYRGRQRAARGWMLALPLLVGYGWVGRDNACHERCVTTSSHALTVDGGFQATYWGRRLGFELRLLAGFAQVLAYERHENGRPSARLDHGTLFNLGFTVGIACGL